MLLHHKKIESFQLFQQGKHQKKLLRNSQLPGACADEEVKRQVETSRHNKSSEILTIFCSVQTLHTSSTHKWRYKIKEPKKLNVIPKK